MNSKPKHIKILEGLFKLPENKECADCKSRAPRWTSINLGIFICLQCSGIHRSLGVHISKVRSATLDTWLPEQVSFMKSMGNGKANAYWEAELPPHYNRGQIQNFIRAKYVEKRWIPKDCKDKSPSEPQPQLLSSRSSRRYGCIAEWTNSQHKLKDGGDFSVDEKDRAVSRPGTGEVSIDRADTVNQHQHQEKKDNYRPPLDQRANVSIHNVNQHQEKKDNSRPPLDQRANVSIHNVNQHQENKDNSRPPLDQRANISVRSVNGKPSKEPTQVVRSFSVNDSLRKSEQVSKIKQTAANAMPSIPSPKVDYADELFRTLFMDDSADNNSTSNMNEWIRFDSDQKSSTPEAKIVPETAVGKEILHKANSAVKPAASNFTLDFQTAMVPFLTGHLGEQQKYVTNDKQRLSDKSNNMVPASSMHLQQLAKPAQGVSSTDASKLPVSTNGFQRQLYVNGGRVMNTTGSQMPMQNFQRMNSAPYTMSRFQGPAFPSKGISVAPARGPPASLPVSGYDYDFSVLTQGMFTKR